MANIKNSYKDLEMIAAVEKSIELIKAVAGPLGVARDEFIENPRWIGVPSSKQDNIDDVYGYPRVSSGVLARLDGRPDSFEVKKYANSGEAYKHFWDPKNEERGHLWHQLRVIALHEHFSEGWPFHVYDVPSQHRHDGSLRSLSPRAFMDTTRKVFRNMHRFDADNDLTISFALMKYVKRGAPREDDSKRVKIGDKLPMVQDWDLKPLGNDSPLITPVLRQVSDAIKAVYSHAALSLLPRELLPDDEKFVRWMRDRGGSATQGEINEFLIRNGIRGNGQFPPQCKTFCEKSGPPRSRTPWILIPEAEMLLK